MATPQTSFFGQVSARGPLSKDSFVYCWKKESRHVRQNHPFRKSPFKFVSSWTNSSLWIAPFVPLWTQWRAYRIFKVDGPPKTSGTKDRSVLRNTGPHLNPVTINPVIPHVPSWAIFLSEGFRGSVRAIPSQEPVTLVLKRKNGRPRNHPGDHPWEVKFPQNWHLTPALGLRVAWPAIEVPNPRTPKSAPGGAWGSAGPRWGAPGGCSGRCLGGCSSSFS